MPCRLVPGDGAIPLERLLEQLLEAGYRGPFDLELLGPEIEREGPGRALRRGADWLRAALMSAS
jgi:sugar phosphate isomerase/epimerase